MSQSESLMSMALSMLVCLTSVTWTFGASVDRIIETESVLNKVAEEIQIELSLGQLAAQRASNVQVKDFGQQMVADHKLASQQIEVLALERGLKLSPVDASGHQRQLGELSSLSGHAFDREYPNYRLRDHESTLEDLRRFMGKVQDQGIQQWMNVLVPILESHREKAVRVKQSLQTNP